MNYLLTKVRKRILQKCLSSNLLKMHLEKYDIQFCLHTEMTCCPYASQGHYLNGLTIKVIKKEQKLPTGRQYYIRSTPLLIKLYYYDSYSDLIICLLAAQVNNNLYNKYHDKLHW